MLITGVFAEFGHRDWTAALQSAGILNVLHADKCMDPAGKSGPFLPGIRYRRQGQ